LITKNGITFGPQAWTHLEISDNCSLRCRMCEQAGELEWHRDKTKVHPVSRSHMSLELWEKILNDFAAMGIEFNEVDPFWMGESLLNPHFPEMMQSLKAINLKHRLFKTFKLHTNGLNLSAINANAVLDCCAPLEYSRVVFSVDAVRSATFLKVKGVDGMDMVNHNIRDFISAKLSRGMVFPKVVLQLIVLEENQDEVGEFVAYWQEFLKEEGLATEFCHKTKKEAMVAKNNAVIIFFEKENTSPAKDAAAWGRYNSVVSKYGNQ